MKKALLTCLILILLVYVWFILLDGPIQSLRFAYTVPRESRRLLASGNTLAEIRQNAGGLSLELEFGDSQWLAIRYKDSHAGAINSYALARFSDGTWMESDFHFCGSFAGVHYSKRWLRELEGMDTELTGEEQAEMRETALKDLRESKLGELVFSKTPAEAKAAMVRLGFREIQVPP